MNEPSDGISDTGHIVWAASALTDPPPRQLARVEAGGVRLPSTMTAKAPRGLEPEASLDWALASSMRPSSPHSLHSMREPILPGRRSECETLARLAANLRTGHSQVLVLRGEEGIGKSALLDYLLTRSSGCQVARATGVESERELAFGGLHQLCAQFLDRLERLPAAQRDALGTAVGLSEGGAPDRLLVGTAVFSLLRAVAAEGPLVCAVDDGQWIDSESMQALSFVARRVRTEGIGLLLIARGGTHAQLLAGLPELALSGLGDQDARALLESVVKGPLDELVRARILAETRGNPLALLTLGRAMTPEQLAGGFGLLEAPALSAPIAESFRRRLAGLPPATQRLLLVAAAEPCMDQVVLWRAASRLDVGAEDAVAAATAGLVEFDGQLRFRDPVVRSAVYRTASPQARQGAHRALAEAADPVADPDRCAWHRARATVGLDEDVARALECSAARARARCGLAAAAAFHKRAAELTSNPTARAARTLTAAEAKHAIGASEVAFELLASVDTGSLDEHQRARAELLRAQIAVEIEPLNDAATPLVTAAKRLETLDVCLARATHRDALDVRRLFTVDRRLTSVVPRPSAQAGRHAPAAACRPLLPPLDVTKVDAHLRPAEPLHRLAIQQLCVLAVAQERARPCLDSRRPIGTARAQGLCEALERGDGAGSRAGSGARFDQLYERQGRQSDLTALLSRAFCRDKRLAILTATVVEHGARPLRDGQPLSFAAREHLVRVRCDQRSGVSFPPLPGGDHERAVRPGVATRGGGDRLSLRGHRARRADISADDLRHDGPQQAVPEQSKRSGSAGELDQPGAQHQRALVVPDLVCGSAGERQPAEGLVSRRVLMYELPQRLSHETAPGAMRVRDQQGDPLEQPLGSAARP